MKKVLILNYHQISLNTSDDALYTLSPLTFKHHLDLIQELRIPFRNVEDFMAGHSPEEYAVMLSFDDGYKSDLTEVMPLLEAYQFPAIFFPITDRIGEPDRLSWEELNIISGKGFEIGSHSASHRILTDLALPEIKKELKDSKDLIEQNIGKRVKHFALPYGRYNTSVIETAKELGYESVLTTGLTCNFMDENSFLLYRWNITSEVSIATLKRVLQYNGNLPLKMRLDFSIKKSAKAILGQKLAEKLNRKIVKHG